MLKGLAYVRLETPSVVAGDYGTDLFGGANVLRETPPYKRRPRWRNHLAGPPCSYDVALHLDFVDLPGYEAYHAHPSHTDISAFNVTVAENELTARIEWEYEGSPQIKRGMVRHTAMFIWAEDADDAARQVALAAVKRLESAPGVESITTGRGIPLRGALQRTSDFDWILDVQLIDPAATLSLLNGDLYAGVMQEVAAVTKYEWTARLSHVMRGL